MGKNYKVFVVVVVVVYVYVVIVVAVVIVNYVGLLHTRKYFNKAP